MKVEDFNGFLEFKEETFPFSFSDNKITIHPHSIDKWNELLGEWFHHSTNKKNKWLDKIIIDGITAKRKGVKFFVTDSPAYFNGYYTFTVDYMYIYDINHETNDMYDVKGIRFKGPEINYFYNVSDYIKTDFKTKNNSFDKFSLELNSKDDKKFGKFRWHNYSVSVKGSFSWKKENDTYGPLEINSLLILELSRSCNDLKKLIELIQIQDVVMFFNCYRKNITYTEIDTYCYTKDGLKRKIGNFYVFDDEYSDFNEKKEILKQIITLNDTSEEYSQIYKLCVDNNLYTTHICSNYHDRHLYTPARILSIIIAFEHSFKIFYPNIEIQSPELNIAKEEINNFIDNKITSTTGKLKKKYKNIKNSIDKIDVSYGEHLKYALNDNYKILKEFIGKRYQVKNPRFVISSCSTRVNTIRNQMAHGKLDINYKPINSNDIYLIELLLYSMALKHIGLRDDLIISKIKCLFNIR